MVSNINSRHHGSPFEIIKPKYWAAPKATPMASQRKAGSFLLLVRSVGTRKRNSSGRFRRAILSKLLNNIVDRAGGCRLRAPHLVRLNWYVTDKAEYAARQGEIGSLSSEDWSAFPGDDVGRCCWAPGTPRQGRNRRDGGYRGLAHTGQNQRGRGMPNAFDRLLPTGELTHTNVSIYGPTARL